MSKSKIPYEKKAEIVKDYLDGRVGYAESLKRENCGRESFRCWVHLYKEKGAAWLSRATWFTQCASTWFTHFLLDRRPGGRCVSW